MYVRRRGGPICHALAALMAAIASPSPALAEDQERPGDVAPSPRFEFWTGAQAYDRVWSLYSGTTVAPFGDIQVDGIRLRLVGGYGSDRYWGARAVGQGSQIMSFKGTGSFVDLLAGYQQQVGTLTVKVFGGANWADRAIVPVDTEARVQGTGFGAKVALETWWNISNQTWTSVDLSWSSLYDSYATRARVGWRATPAFSMGLESGAAGNVEGSAFRAAGFVRYELASGEISASAGASTDKILDAGGGPAVARATTPYVTLSWLTRF